MKKTYLLSFLVSGAAALQSAPITAVPAGGMLMPMITINAATGGGSNPTSGSININFTPMETPILKPLTEWSPGNWFEETAAWRDDLSPVDGTVGGMPSANAGSGDLFNNRYGFMYMGNGSEMMAFVPDGNAIAIKLVNLSSSDLMAFNYGNGDNRWDQVFSNVGDQVLWNGTMWHNYFTMPANTPAGTYTAEFEIFLVTTEFTGTTGFAQYDTAAQSALKNENFTSGFLTYEFTVVPEPAQFAIGLGVVCLGLVGVKRRRRAS